MEFNYSKSYPYSELQAPERAAFDAILACGRRHTISVFSPAP